jgi:hypothetical protein
MAGNFSIGIKGDVCLAMTLNTGNIFVGIIAYIPGGYVNFFVRLNLSHGAASATAAAAVFTRFRRVLQQCPFIEVTAETAFTCQLTALRAN